MNPNEKLDRYIQINSNNIRYRIIGNGESTILLVHGLAGYIEEWGDSVPLLSKKYKVVLFDLIGHGLSDKPDIKYTIDALTECVIGFMKQMNIKNPTLIGHSLGGAICLNLAIQYPDIVKNLILVNCAGEIIPTNMKLGSLGISRYLSIKPSRLMLKVFSYKSIHNRKLITDSWIDIAYKYINLEGNFRAMFSILRENINLGGLKKDIKTQINNGIKNINMPVLIICAANDKTLPNTNSFNIHKQIPHSIFKVFKNCSHELPYECPERFAEEVQKFLNMKFLIQV